MRDLLYLAHRIPYPPDKGDKVRSFQEVQHLARSFRVHLGTFVDDPHDWAHVVHLREYCGETHFARLDPPLARLRSLSGLLRGEALSLAYYRDAGLAHWVREMLRAYPIRHCLIYSSPMAQYLRHSPQLVRVADFVDVDSEKWRQYAAARAWPLSWVYARESRTLAAFEREIAREFDATLLVTSQEAQVLRAMAPESALRIGHVDSGVDAEYFSPMRAYDNPHPARTQPIVFTGSMDYWPNVDAVRWFATEIFPAVRARHTQAHFCIVGARPSANVRKLATLDGVVVTGSVPDVRPYLAHARLAVAPLRFARGLQNKILEAMAMARTVVASPEGATGITARAGEELLVASGPGAFADTVSRYLTSDARHAVGAAARARVLADYSWRTNLGRLDDLLAAGAAP